MSNIIRKESQNKWIGIFITSVVLLFSGVFVFFIMNVLKGDAYEMSLMELKNNIDVIERLGEPLKASYFVLGSISTKGDSGQATLEYSVQGSKASGTVYVNASKISRRWTLDALEVQIKSTSYSIVVVE